MKKVLCFILVLTLFTVLITIDAQAADWTLPQGASAQPTIRFAFLSDAHISSNNLTNSSELLKTALSSYKNLDVDAVVLNGDIVMHQEKEKTKDAMIPQYKRLKEVLSSLNISTKANTIDVEVGTTPLIYATGNHEFPIGATASSVCETAIEVFEEQMSCTQNSHTIINNIHFITSGGDTYSSNAKHQELWMKQEIESAKQQHPDNPIFLVLHHPVQDTVEGSNEGYNRYSDDFKNYLNENPTIIVLSAHTHITIKDPKNIWQDGFTVVGGAYVGSSTQKHSQGYLVEVTGNIVKFFKMDWQTGNYIADPWVVDITDLSDYTVAGREEANAPSFAPDAKITASNVTDKSATITWDNATVVPTGAYQDKYIAEYQVKVTDENGVEIYDKTVETDYYKNDGKAQTSIKLEGLTGNQKYTVAIKAVSLLDKVSNELTLEFYTTDPALSRAIYSTFECEDNVVVANSAGSAIAQYIREDKEYASGGKGVCVAGGATHTWEFVPAMSGYYTFEIVADGDNNQSVMFKVNGNSVYNDIINTTGAWKMKSPQKTVLCNVYMTAGESYALTLKNSKTAMLDYFNVYYEDIIEAEDCTTKENLGDTYSEDGTKVISTTDAAASGTKVVNLSKDSNIRIPVTAFEKGLYGISITGKGAANAYARIDEKITDSNITKFIKNPKAISLASDGTLVNAVVLYMDKGAKTLTLTVDDDYTIDCITVKKLSNIPLYDNIIETENYISSNTYAYTAFYGDYTSNIFSSGLKGENIEATYNVNISKTTDYRLNMVADTEDAEATISISVDGGTPYTAKVNQESGKTYISTLELQEGNHTVSITLDGNADISALVFEEGKGTTDEMNDPPQVENRPTEEVVLDDVPKTGDIMTFWIAVSGGILAGTLVGMAVLNRRKKK